MRFLDLEQARGTVPGLPDVYYSAEYGGSAEIIDRGTWECAVSHDGIAFPYVRRAVGDSTEYDLVTPYGYGGVVLAESLDRLGHFRREFLELSRERGLVAEFLRCHPFDMDPATVAAMRVGEIRWHTTYSIRGAEDATGYWATAEGRHRTAVRKAHKSGVELRTGDISELKDASSTFRVLYSTTMDRVGSSARLRVGDEYFARLVDGLGDRVILVEAWTGDGPCAASLFLSWGDRLHYHLSGSTADGMRIGASNAIIDHAVRRLMSEHGRLHLGGGLGGDDGLSRFKESMATDKHAMALCRTVVNPSRYAALNKEAGVDDTTDYFPAYRSVMPA